MNTSVSSQHTRTPGDLYHIRVGQHLDCDCTDWLGGLAITNLQTGEALLSGYLVDQAALYGVLQRLRDLNVNLIEVRRGEAT
jgi:hypothetical protein